MTPQSLDSVPYSRFIDSLKGFVAWVGGAVAGLSVLFYAAGYLAYRAHTNMLGLTGVIDFPHEQLLYEGAKFFLTVGAYLLNGLFVIGIALLVALIVGTLLRQMGWLDRIVRNTSQGLRAWRDRLRARHPRLLDTCTLLLLAILFVIHSDRFYYPLQDVYPRIERLVYQAPAPAAACPAVAATDDGAMRAVTLWLQQGEKCRPVLLAEFRRLLAGYLLLLLVVGYFAFSRPLKKRSTIYRVAIATLTAYAVLYTVLLPMAFGVLVRSPIYPVITLKAKATPPEGAARLMLLNKRDDALLVWDAVGRKAAWLPTDDTMEIYVHGQANLFEVPSPEGVKP